MSSLILVILAFSLGFLLHKKFGKHPKEAMFYVHALPLPAFLLMSSSITSQFKECLDSAPLLTIPLLRFSLPSLLAFLVGNVLTQYWCSAAVFLLSTECSSLTVVLVLTLKKFFSLLFSVWYFNNEFTNHHWVGTGLVMAGSLLYSQIHTTGTKQTEAESEMKKDN